MCCRAKGGRSVPGRSRSVDDTGRAVNSSSSAANGQKEPSQAILNRLTGVLPKCEKRRKEIADGSPDEDNSDDFWVAGAAAAGDSRAPAFEQHALNGTLREKLIAGSLQFRPPSSPAKRAGCSLGTFLLAFARFCSLGKGGPSKRTGGQLVPEFVRISGRIGGRDGKDNRATSLFKHLEGDAQGYARLFEKYFYDLSSNGIRLVTSAATSAATRIGFAVGG